jgi:outer membrane protein assembly factor BamD
MSKNMMKIAKNSVLVILLITIFSSCSEYEKVLKSSNATLKYEKAMAYYKDGDFARSSTLFEQLIPYTRGTAQADTISFYHALSYYKQRDYILAGHYFKEFTKDFPKDKFSEEAAYLGAYCYYLTSPRPELDQSNTYQAIQSFQLFMVKYPNSKHVPDCMKLIEELRNKLINKSYMSAKLYYNLGDYKSSIIALRNSLNEYPDTKYREEIMFLILKSNYLLADNSVASKQKERYQATLDEYYSFVSEFPDSQYNNEVKQIYNVTSNYLN